MCSDVGDRQLERYGDFVLREAQGFASVHSRSYSTDRLPRQFHGRIRNVEPCLPGATFLLMAAPYRACIRSAHDDDDFIPVRKIETNVWTTSARANSRLFFCPNISCIWMWQTNIPRKARAARNGSIRRNMPSFICRSIYATIGSRTAIEARNMSAS